MDFHHPIVTCLFSMLRLSFDIQKVNKSYTIFQKDQELSKKDNGLFKKEQELFLKDNELF